MTITYYDYHPKKGDDKFKNNKQTMSHYHDDVYKHREEFSRVRPPTTHPHNSCAHHTIIHTIHLAQEVHAPLWVVCCRSVKQPPLTIPPRVYQISNSFITP